jgi:hypothetical protein
MKTKRPTAAMPALPLDRPALSADADRDVQILHALAEIGMSHAELLRGRAATTTDPKELDKITRDFERIAESICQTIALERKLAARQATPDGQSATRRPDETATGLEIPPGQTVH